MRKGQHVETLTKKVGQSPRRGVVVALRGEEFVEVKWEDGHTSVISRSDLTEVRAPKRSEDKSG